jgi:hypothetical protein
MQHHHHHHHHHHHQHHPSRVLLPALVGLLAGGQVAAAAPPPRAEPAPAVRVRDASTCPALFGGARTHTLNTRTRAAHLDWITEERAGVTIVHTDPAWVDPTPLRIVGLRLAGVQGTSADFVLSGARAAELGCPAGRYRLRVDDSIGRRSQVLAVLRGGVLVAWGGALRYIPAPDTSRLPRWLLAWRMDGASVSGAALTARRVHHRTSIQHLVIR